MPDNAEADAAQRIDEQICFVPALGERLRSLATGEMQRAMAVLPVDELPPC